MSNSREADRRNLQKRRERRRKRRMKPKIKFGIFMFSIFLLIGGLVSYKYYLNINADPFGEIDSGLEVDNEVEQIEYETATYTILGVDGEAILIRDGDVEALIDTGSRESKTNLISELNGRISGVLDYLIITNDSDKRIGGIKAVYDNYEVDKTILGNLSLNKSKLMELAKKHSSSVEEGCDNSYAIKKSMLSTMRPAVTSNRIEDKSLVTVFSINGKNFVALSDAGKEEVERCLGNLGAYEVVVLSQHGSETPNEVLLGKSDYATAGYIVATCNKGQGFPSEEMLEEYSFNSYATYKSGSIEFLIEETTVSTEAEPFR